MAQRAEALAFWQSVDWNDQPLRNDLVDYQGFGNCANYYKKNDDDVKTAIKAMTSSSGMVANPLHPGPGQQPFIPNRGFQVSAFEATRLKQVVFYCRYLHIVQRTFDPANTAVADIELVWEHRNAIKLYENEHQAPTKWNKNILMKSQFDMMEEFFSLKLGQNNIPYNYIIRTDAVPPAEGGPDDPGLGQPTFMEELTSRARHDGADWTANNQFVWSIIRTVFFDTPVYEMIRNCQRQKNGRRAWFILYDHYLGESYQLRQRAKANTILSKCFYDGRSRNFTLDDYFTRLQSAFNDLPDDEMPNQRKMEIMLKGLRDPTLAATKNTITATPRLNSDYRLSIDYIAEQDDRLRQDRAQKAGQRNIAGLDVGAGVGPGRGRGRGFHRGGRGGRGPGRGRFGRGGRGGHGRGRGSGRGTVFNPRNPGRYYQPHEWRALTKEQRDQARKARPMHQQQQQARAFAAAASSQAYHEAMANNLAAGVAQLQAAPALPPAPQGIQQPTTQIAAVRTVQQPPILQLGATMSRRPAPGRGRNQP